MESLIGLLPFAIVAVACPLLMILMMRGMHGGHGEHADHAAHGAPEAGDEQTAERLRAMEEEITELRRELAAAKGVEQAGISRNGGRS